MWGIEEQKQEFARLYPMFYGKHEERNYGKAIKVIKKISEAGYVPAICTLGIACFDHLGVHRNYNESFIKGLSISRMRNGKFLCYGISQA